MLEHASILVEPWSKVASGKTHERIIRAAPAGEFLGIARRIVEPAWLSWLAGRAIRVFETEDESLLLTVQRPWGMWQKWGVFDAEERFVGSVYGRIVWPAGGRRLVLASRSEYHGARHSLDDECASLGRFEVMGKSIQLTFDQSVTDDPFARMLLLGAVLTWDM
jgi:hypothetical protein